MFSPVLVPCVQATRAGQSASIQFTLQPCQQTGLGLLRMAQLRIRPLSIFQAEGVLSMGDLSIQETLGALAVGPQVHTDLPAALLVERSLRLGESCLAANGALVAYTGSRTGRSPKDKFTVEDNLTHALVCLLYTSPSPRD